MPLNPFEFLQGFLGSQLLPNILQIGVGYIVLLWIFLILWVAKDASHRSESLFFQLVAVLIIVITTPLIGLPLYLLIRPSTTILERELYDMLHYMVTGGEDLEEDGEEDIIEKPKPKKEKEKRSRRNAEGGSTEERDQGITYVDEEEE